MWEDQRSCSLGHEDNMEVPGLCEDDQTLAKLLWDVGIPDYLLHLGSSQNMLVTVQCLFHRRIFPEAQRVLLMLFLKLSIHRD